MCTVTVVPHETGIRMMCNRDERRTRPPAIPPRVQALGGRLAAFPVDPRGGGTWIGVNDAGIAVSLLNHYSVVHSVSTHPTRSRGLIVRELLRCGCLSQALDVAGRLDVSVFEMFRLVIVHGFSVGIATHDGARMMTCRQIPLDTPLLFTSSSLRDARVEAARRRLFQRILVQRRTGWLDGQARFHRHQWPSTPEMSVRMEREDALTVSRTVVDVTRTGRVVLYEAPVSEQPSREGRTCCFWH